MPKLIKGKITDNLETNVVIAEHQDEYNSLPAHVTYTGVVAFAYELSDEEIEQIKKTKRVYVSMLTFGNPLQPHYLTTNPELLDKNVKHYDNEYKAKFGIKGE